MDFTGKSPTIVSFCTGYGGFEIGLERVFGRLSPLAYVEIEAFAIYNLVAKMEAGTLVPTAIYTDVKTFPSRQFRGLVDVLTAGFPCQPFSSAGMRGADDDPRHLFPFIEQSVEDMQPSIILLENIEGIISAKLKGNGWADPEGAPVLLHVLRELERLGYRTEAGMFSAEEVGAPHRRNRVFIMAVREGVDGRGLPFGEKKNSEFRGVCEHVADCLQSGLQGHPGDEQKARGQGVGPHRSITESGLSLWPARPGEPQFEWEPPRVVQATDIGDPWVRTSNRHGPVGHPANDDRSGELRFLPKNRVTGGAAENHEREENVSRETQPKMGRSPHGCADWVDYAELCVSCDNRVDELRLLGNGVVPATAEQAIRVLLARLMAHCRSA